MRTILLLATLLLVNINLFSQGGVDVKYIPIDSVDNHLIGQRIKIDFKSSNGTKKYLIQKARTRDTVELTIDNKLIKVVEVKGIGTDYWYFDKEYLESFDYYPEGVLRIKEIEILDIRLDSIQFRLTMDQFKKLRKKLEQISSENRDIWISKDKIEGILTKE